MRQQVARVGRIVFELLANAANINGDAPVVFGEFIPPCSCFELRTTHQLARIARERQQDVELLGRELDWNAVLPNDELARIEFEIARSHVIDKHDLGPSRLSRMILAYEHEGLSVDLNLIAQYLQDQEIAEDFSLYLELFEKYQDDYQVSAILSGAAGEELKDRAKEAPFDERVALVNLLLDVLLGDVHRLAARKKALLEVRQILAKLKEADSGVSLLASLTAQENECQLELRRLVASGFASGARQMAEAKKGEILEAIRKAVARAVAQAGGSLSQEDAYNAAKESFNAMVRDLGAGSKEFVSKIDCAIDFVNDAYGDSQEMLIFMTRLAVDPDFMHFVAEHGSKKFVEHSRGLMFHDRSTQLLNEVDKLEGLA